MNDFPFIHIAACDEPLSSDVFIIKGQKATWIFDAGNGEPYASKLNKTEGERNLILSHFHSDHTENVKTVSFSKIYAGKYTIQHIEEYAENAVIVNEDLFIKDGDLNLHIFPMPASHSKGSVAMEINDEYIFMGDAAYACRKDGKLVYNASKLREQIDTLKALKGNKCVLSHERKLVYRKQTVILNLERILKKQEKNNPYIELE